MSLAPQEVYPKDGGPYKPPNISHLCHRTSNHQAAHQSTSPRSHWVMRPEVRCHLHGPLVRDRSQLLLGTEFFTRRRRGLGRQPRARLWPRARENRGPEGSVCADHGRSCICTDLLGHAFRYPSAPDRT